MRLSTSSSKMKKYILGFFLFILCVWLFDKGLFYLITTLEGKFYSKNQFEKRLEKYLKDKKFSTLIFGTSRTYEGIHPLFLEKELGIKAFKEAGQGRGPKYYYYLYNLYKKYAGIPKVVIYGVDYFIYSVESDPKYMSRFETGVPKDKISLFDSPLLLIKYKSRIDNFHNNLLVRLTEKKNPDAAEESVQDFISIQDYIGTDLPNKNKKLVLKRPPDSLEQYFIQYPGTEGHWFVDFLDELNRDNVTVILVLLPDFLGTYKTNFQQKFFIREMKKLKTYCHKLFVYNYNHPGKFPLQNPDFFMDGGWGQPNSHLSLSGARVLNELLIKDLRKFYRRP